MTRRPANVTQADIARAIRAIQQTGSPLVAVEIATNGTVRIVPIDEPQKAAPDATVAVEREIIL